MSKKLEKLADEMINLSPEDGQKLAMIIRAKVMPEQAKMQQQQGLLQQQNPQAQQNTYEEKQSIERTILKSRSRPTTTTPTPTRTS